jgi:D-3-phosphoglycerate dehydrogenase
MTKIVTTSPGFGKHGRLPRLLADKGWSLIRCADPSLSDGGVAQHIADADFLVAGLLPVTAHTLEGGLKLKGVLKHGVGVDNIDVTACTSANLPVTNTPGANADAVAELALGLMFALARNIAQSHSSVAAGGWERKVGTQVGGKTLGIIGLGNIGRRLALLARGVGMSVIASDPYADVDFAEANRVELASFEEVLKRADYVSLHVFGGADNSALISRDTLALMRQDACLLNLSRGEVVDLDAVEAALKSGALGGVAIDAYVSEPPDRRHPIFSNPKAIFMPHSGADTREAVENMGLMVVEDIETILAGGMPKRCLNAHALHTA